MVRTLPWFVSSTAIAVAMALTLTLPQLLSSCAWSEEKVVEEEENQGFSQAFSQGFERSKSAISNWCQALHPNRNR
jgi:hypothetical protein